MRAGDRVELAFTVRNDGDEPVDLYLQGRSPTVDVKVEDERGTALWHRLADDVIPAVVLLHTLTPGESLRETVPWSVSDAGGRPLRPGSYLVRAWLITETGRLEAPARALTVR